MGKVTTSTPLASIDYPLNPVSVALGAETTFVARTVDDDAQHLQDIIRLVAVARSGTGTTATAAAARWPSSGTELVQALRHGPAAG
jgi:pyruvate/2-oxoacid:ferredoxin oxidoreductase beta subunit